MFLCLMALQPLAGGVFGCWAGGRLASAPFYANKKSRQMTALQEALRLTALESESGGFVQGAQNLLTTQKEFPAAASELMPENS